MANKLDILMRAYQGNAYPSMLADLGAHLGVSPESLARLGIGWAPVVPFKKGANAQGWWAIPERDSNGQPVGIALRSQHDFKVMYPGSKHGLVYPINPDHERGGQAYQHGAQNWLRTMEAGIDCPVCGKPDGCLVSAANPDDPAAVICIRKKEGAKQPMSFGYLHILKDEGNIRKDATALPSSEHPVLVVEGMSDAAAALDLGFVAVGRPSNLAGLDLLKELVRGRSVVVLGENDEKADGQFPGKEGMIATFLVLRDVCPEVLRVMPPDGVKDLRHWVQLGVSASDLLQHVEKQGVEPVKDIVLSDARPMTAAIRYLMDHYRTAGRWRVRSFNDTWFVYDEHKYAVTKDSSIVHPLYRWAHDKYVSTDTAGGQAVLKPVHADRTWVRNVAEAMAAETDVPQETAPCWINGGTGPNPLDLISFANGILCLEDYLAGGDFDSYMRDSTPDFFTLTALPFAFDPAAKCPQWEKWCRSSLGDDSAKIRLLQEWFGYCMTSDGSHQKLLFMQGVPASGKSTAINVLRDLVGHEQFATVKFRNLVDRFSLHGLLGKLVAAMPDFRLPAGGTSLPSALETLLNIVGNDCVNTEQKFKDVVVDTRLHCRFTIASNEMPDFSDHSGAFKRRLLLLEYRRSFEGREDRSLPGKFQEERDGIAVWALEGLRRLRSQGQFTIPASMEAVLTDWHHTASPVPAFVEECIVVAAGESLGKRELFEAFTQWTTENGLAPGAYKYFTKRVLDRLPGTVKATSEMRMGRKVSVYDGITLVPWAMKQYLRRPTNV